MPPSLPVGDYDIGFAFVDKAGNILPIKRDAEDNPTALSALAQLTPEGEDPRFAKGEVFFKDAMTIISHDERDQQVADKLAKLDQMTSDGQCGQAEKMLEAARWHQPKSEEWVEENYPPAMRKISNCWVSLANQSRERKDKVDALARARTLDHHTPSLLIAAAPIADSLHEEGMAAMDKQDWEAAYTLFTDALRVDASRAWSRKYAEEARAHRLGLGEFAKPKDKNQRPVRQPKRTQRRVPPALKENLKKESTKPKLPPKVKK